MPVEPWALPQSGESAQKAAALLPAFGSFLNLNKGGDRVLGEEEMWCSCALGLLASQAGLGPIQAALLRSRVRHRAGLAMRGDFRDGGPHTSLHLPGEAVNATAEVLRPPQKASCGRGCLS